MNLISDNPNQEAWQKGEFSRILGDYYLSIGKLKNAQEMLSKSIGYNKKEAKTWISYGRLNEIVYNHR